MNWSRVRAGVGRCGVVVAAGCALWGLASFAWAVNPVDERGAQPGRELASELPFEHIDPHTGNLLLTFADLTIPGNAGFEVKIQRTYNSKIFFNLTNSDNEFNEVSWAGVGWTMHLGRVIESTGSENPIIEMPDGSHHEAFPRHVGDTGTFYTKDFWVFERYAPEGATLSLPSGVKYVFKHRGNFKYQPTGQRPIYYATRIYDPFGNQALITYFAQSTNFPLPRDAMEKIVISGPGGPDREVTFGYDHGKQALTWMRFDGRTWEYTVENLGNTGISTQWGPNGLTQVRPPEGRNWIFRYYGYSDPNPRWLLRQIELPTGGLISYKHAKYGFPTCNGGAVTHSPAVHERTVGGREVPGGTWTYQYLLNGGNQTRINAPCRSTLYTFANASGCPHAELWRTGSLVTKQVFSGTTEVDREDYVWHRSQQVSPVTETIGNVTQAGVYAALQHQKKVTRQGRSWTTTHWYSAQTFSDWGVPHQTDEVGELSRQTKRTIKHDFTRYIRGRVTSETVTVNGESFTSSWVYDNNTGFKTSETSNGITTTFGPDAGGNVAWSTNANAHTTHFTNKWGAVTQVRTPMHTTDRDVNRDGTIAWERRRGFITYFSYDKLGRQTRVAPPLGEPTVKVYGSDGTTVTTIRGDNVSTEHVDGLGRVTWTQDPVGVRRNVAYDNCGRKTFESLPYYHATESWRKDTGVRTTHDALDRVATRTQPDNTLARWAFFIGGSGPTPLGLTSTDENNHSNTQYWKAFGHPDDHVITTVIDANGNRFDYAYNALGSLTSVQAPGTTQVRRFIHNPKNQLQRECQPEFGLVDPAVPQLGHRCIDYTYYPAGNLWTRRDTDGLVTTYIYDDNERLRFVDRVVDYHDTEIRYDESDNRTYMKNGAVETWFAFDGANRLEDRRDTTYGHTVNSHFYYNRYDGVREIKYPSGRRVTYGYDGAGRVTLVSGVDAGGNWVRDYAQNFEYHASGVVKSFQAGNGIVHDTELDDRGRIHHAWDSMGILDLTYGYDNVSNVMRIDDPRPGRTMWFQYDLLDRLRYVNGEHRYEYDARGNRSWKRVNGAVTFYGYDGNTDRLATVGGQTFAYDGRGNVYSDGQQTYTYTPSNLLEKVGAGAVHYRYDGADMRTVKTQSQNIRYYFRGAAGEVLSEFIEGQCGFFAERDYVYGAARLLASVRTETLEDTGPSGLGGTAISTGEARLTWQDNNPIEGGYRLERKLAVGGTWQDVASVGANVTSHVDSGLQPGQAYLYRVRAVCGAQGSAYSNEALVTMPTVAVAFEWAESYITERVGAVAPRVVLTTSNGTPSYYAVAAQYTTEDDTALAPADYTATSGAVSFPAGAAHGTLIALPAAIPIVDDTTFEPVPETFRVRLHSASGASFGPRNPHVIRFLAEVPPVADAGGPYRWGAGHVVSLDGSRSTDADSVIVAYRWTFGDGGTGTGAILDHLYGTPGPYTVTLTVEDQDGATATASASVTIDDPSLAREVTWKQIVGATASGGALTKTGPDGWDAGAVSGKKLASGDGYVTFVANQADKHRLIGLGEGNTSADQSDVEFGIHLHPAGAVHIRESGVGIGQVGTYRAGDRFRVAIEQGQVVYRKNGAPLRARTAQLTYPIVVDVSLYSDGASVEQVSLAGIYVPNVPPVAAPGGPYGVVSGEGVSFDGTASDDADGRLTAYEWTFGDGTSGTGTHPTHAYALPGIYAVTLKVTDEDGASHTASTTVEVGLAQPVKDVVWMNVVGATAAGNALTKTATTAAWDAGAVSTKKVVSGEGYVEFSVPDTQHFRMAGFGNGDTDQSVADIAYAFYTQRGGGLRIYESGAPAPGQWTYEAGDRFRITVRGGAVKYWKNQRLVRASTTAPQYPLLVDTTLFEAGASITAVRISAAFGPNQPPTAHIAGLASAVCGELLTFDATASSDADGAVMSYAWEFGDQSSGTGARAPHRYSWPGAYVVGLTVTDDDGATASTTANVQLSAAATVFWRNMADGAVRAWFMQGTSKVGESVLVPSPVDLDWQIVGVGDFSGDGRPDLVWRRQSNGEVGYWYMDGPLHNGGASVAGTSLQWHLKAVGDFNSDGKPDIVWQDPATGVSGPWYMDGPTRLGNAGFPAAPSASWEIVAADDFDNDGHTDLLWRDPATSAVALWFMKGVQKAGQADLINAGSDWKVVGTGDFNGDGYVDIDWWNSATGVHATWRLRGGQFDGGDTLPRDSGVTWRPVAYAPKPRAAAPAMLPFGGSHEAPLDVTVSCATTGSKVRYTVDGSEPPDTLPTLECGQTVRLERSGTLSLKAWSPRLEPSFVRRAAFALRPPKPTLDPPGGRFDAPLRVRATSTLPDVVFRYTTDGSDPLVDHPAVPLDGVLVDRKLLLKVRAFKDGFEPSDASSADFDLFVTPPTFSPPAGLFTGTAQLTLSSVTPQAEIRYTTDGSEPSPGSALFADPIPISTLTTIRAKAFRMGWSASDTVKATYVPKDEGLLFWRNSVSGAVRVWFLDRLSKTAEAPLTPSSGGLDWQIVGVADFSGDGQHDLLWRRQSDGAVGYWYMDGPTQNGGPSFESPGMSWFVRAVGDFNADGKPDIVWQKPSTGESGPWYMDGATRLGTASFPAAPSAAWEIAAAGDFNRDGQTDLLWRHPPTSAVAIWFMNGAQKIGHADVNTAGSNWKVVGTGDFNGDGHLDIDWWSSVDGTHATWRMQDGVVVGGDLLPKDTDVTWQPVGYGKPVVQP